MSRETSRHLNQQVLVGYTAKRGNAWHYRASDQGDEPNHYPGAIPITDVQRRLFYWEPVCGPVETTVQLPVGPDGEYQDVRIEDPDFKAVVHPETRKIFGVRKQGYVPHGFNKWLVQGPAQFLGSDLAIGTAGLLKEGAIAWVQIELEDTIETPEGVAFRPFLTAFTSLDGTFKTTYKCGSQLVVCDNTLDAAIAEGGSPTVKIKHTANSIERIPDVKNALGLVQETGDNLTKVIGQLASEHVSEGTWERFLGEYVPIPEEEGRGRTRRENKRDKLNDLWTNDIRVAPWRNTSFGVLQAVNTYDTHFTSVHNGLRAERNELKFLKGDTAELDASTLGVLASVR